MFANWLLTRATYLTLKLSISFRQNKSAVPSFSGTLDMPTVTFAVFSPLLSIPTRKSLQLPDRRHLVQTERCPTLMCGGVGLGDLMTCRRNQENLSFHVGIIDEVIAVIEYDVVAADEPSGSADSPCRCLCSNLPMCEPRLLYTVVATTVVSQFEQNNFVVAVIRCR